MHDSRHVCIVVTAMSFLVKRNHANNIYIYLKIVHMCVCVCILQIVSNLNPGTQRSLVDIVFIMGSNFTCSIVA